MATLTRTKTPRARSPRETGAQRSKPVVSAKRSIKVVRSCTIERPVEDVYTFCRNPENLTRIIEQPVSITRQSDTESHWSARVDSGEGIAWDAVVITDDPGRLLAWRSREDADLAHAGSLHFTSTSAGVGTQLKVELQYEPPAGKIRANLAKLMGKDAAHHVGAALRKLKSILESGE